MTIIDTLKNILNPEVPGELPFSYRRVASKRRRRTMCISFDPSGNVLVVAAPYTSERAIQRFLWEKQEWILIHSNKIKKVIVAPRLFVDGELFYYLGHPYPLKTMETSTLVPQLVLSETHFVFQVPPLFPKAKRVRTLKKLFEKWYLKKGEEVVQNRVAYFAEKIGAPYKSIRLKEVSSIWGSCSQAGNLNFNWRLIMAPQDVLDYVVVHEVSHLLHHHHGKSFWACVLSLDLEYRTHIRWLKNNKHLLSYE
ncbi:M48 family metallopeptidase [Candidatus Roizmanbacteria bacterium]|nr:M48 family metallopeptidase [Candidatus Roizmanbacteria bacterium]